MDTSTGPVITNPVTGQNRQARIKYTYDGSNNVTNTLTSDVGALDSARTVEMFYDANGRRWQVNDNGKVTKTDYDEIGRVIRVTDPRLVRTRTYWNERNLVSSVELENFWDAPGGASSAVTIASRTYHPSLPLVATETDSLNRVIQSTYWPDDRLKQRTLLNYQPILGATRDVVLGYYEYDAVGNQTLIRQGAAGTGVSTVQRQFGSRNFVDSELLVELGRSTLFEYDDAGRRKEATTGSFIQSWQYKANGLLQASGVGPVGQQFATQYDYDQWGRQTTVTDPRGTGFTTTTGYDLADRITSVTAPTSTIWNATGTTSSSASAVATFGYNTFGDRTHSRDPRNLQTATVYDAFGRPTTVTYPTVAAVTPTEVFTYDAADNRLTAKDRRGFTTNYDYDALSYQRKVTRPIAAVGQAEPDHADYSEPGRAAHAGRRPKRDSNDLYL